MNSKSYAFIAYFLLLPGLQVLVFNQFDLGTQLVPHVYLLFLIFYPSNAEQTIFLVVAFFFGLYIDILHSTMGLHAAACLTAAFLRPYNHDICIWKESWLCEHPTKSNVICSTVCIHAKFGARSPLDLLCDRGFKLGAMAFDNKTIYFR
jgi:cell division protein FtsW (lipid II flippase)